MRFQRLVFSSVAASAAAVGVLLACSSTEETPQQNPAVIDSGAPKIDSGMIGQMEDDAGDAGAQSISLTVPAGGGFVDVATFTLGNFRITFPASAAGKMITVEFSTPEAAGLPNDLGYVVLHLAPTGTTFSPDPVLIKPTMLDQVGGMFILPDNGGPGEGLALNAANDAFVLNHFTQLVITPPGTVCRMPTPTDTAASGRCSDAGNQTTFRSIDCIVPGACLRANPTCCVAPGTSAPGCSAQSPAYGIAWSDYSSATTPASCDDGAGDYDGGASTCGSTVIGFNRGTSGDGGTDAGTLTTCSGTRACQPTAYQLTCDGINCQCKFGDTTQRTFAQGDTCSSAPKFRGHYVRDCNFPLHK